MFFGLVVASFAVGRALGSPAFGYTASKIRKTPYKKMFIAALLLDIAGNMTYVVTRNLYGILVGRFLSGFSSGIVLIS